jgi:predicted enzyme related to lactoylglutathione lyase
MTQRPRPCAVVFAKDVSKLAGFYRDVAGMKEAHRDKDHVVLDDGSFELVIHGIPKQIAAQIRIATPPEVREDTALKLCLPVRAIEQARAKAAELGGKVGPKSKEWEARGFRACDGHDPEGNVFQVRESAPQGEPGAR